MLIKLEKEKKKDLGQISQKNELRGIKKGH